MATTRSTFNDCIDHLDMLALLQKTPEVSIWDLFGIPDSEISEGRAWGYLIMISPDGKWVWSDEDEIAQMTLRKPTLIQMALIRRMRRAKEMILTTE